jgi:peptidoglycan/LPS O-acetylase OafA/YrhL
MDRHQPCPARRIVFLDALRGIAILSVVLFHAYFRWSDVLPFGRAYSSIFRYGWAGVELFFLISGFVILMSLEKCSSLGEFLFRRWARLFPAMLIVSLVIFGTAALVPERPMGSPILRDLLPGLTFVEPSWWEAILGSKQGQLEGVFWSLYVEFKFYVIFGLLYFSLGRQYALALLAVVAALGSRLMYFVATQFNFKVFAIFHDVATLAGGKYYGFFLFGALLYLYYCSRSNEYLMWAALASALAIGEFKGERLIPILLVLILFTLSVSSASFQRVLQNKVLILLGFVSYPLYLIHENLMVAMIIRLNSWVMIPGYLLPILPITLVIFVAWLIAFYLEPWLRQKLIIALNSQYPLRSRAAL